MRGMSLRLGGPYFRSNGPCPYLSGLEWGADYLVSEGTVEVTPGYDLFLVENSFDGGTPVLEEANTDSADRNALEVFSKLLAHGFRRAGRAFYRPSCAKCSECVPLRVDVGAFKPSRDQRRALRKNRDVRVEIGLPTFSEEKFAIYTSFVRQRYPADDPSMNGYRNFFLVHVGSTREFRYLADSRLLGLGIVDLAADAASSVYFFFDPAEARRSLGTYSVLREIDFCRQTGRRYLYLGYRVAGCRAMRYKSNFRPHQLFSASRGWVAEEAW